MNDNKVITKDLEQAPNTTKALIKLAKDLAPEHGTYAMDLDVLLRNGRVITGHR
jgi:hypothetical protein